MTIEFMNVIGFVKFIPFVGIGATAGLIGGIFTTYLRPMGILNAHWPPTAEPFEMAQQSKNQIFYNGDMSPVTMSPYTGPFWAACTVGGAFTGGYLALT